MRLGEETANAPLVYPPTFTSGAWPQDISLNWVPLNQDDPAAQMFWSSQRASQPQTYVTNANSIDGGSNIVHRPISPRHAIMHCSTILYTATIQPLYSHYTATIQPEDVMSEAWGLSAGAPAERSGESTSESTPRSNVLWSRWSYGEFPGAPTVRIGQDSVPRLGRGRKQ